MLRYQHRADHFHPVEDQEYFSKMMVEYPKPAVCLTSGQYLGAEKKHFTYFPAMNLFSLFDDMIQTSSLPSFRT